MARIEPDAKALLEWLLLAHPDTPRKRAKEWILAGRVSVGGEVIRKPHHLLPDPGGALRLGARHATRLECGSGLQVHPRVSLLYLDSALAVVNKGPGIVSVPAGGGQLSALSVVADFLAGKLTVRSRGIGGRPLPPAYRHLKPLPVHRLDQYTSGVFCLATNPAARRHLIDQVKARTMKREYIAFVEGRATLPRGTWRHILQLSRDELRQQTLAESQPRAGSLPREAITHFEVIDEFPLAEGKAFVTKLRLRLETGLKHQIRLQAACAGLPLVGDRTYRGGAHSPSLINRLVVFPRQALHSELLTLEHPEKPGTLMTWTAAWPADLRELEAALRAVRSRAG